MSTPRSVLALWFSLMTTALGACGDRNDKSAETLISAWIQAARDGRAEDFRRAYPTRDELADWLTCPAEVDLAARFEAPNPDFTAWRGTVKLASPNPFSAVAREEVAASGPVGPCSAKTRLGLTRLDTTLADGRVLRLRLIEVDGRFRILGY